MSKNMLYLYLEMRHLLVLFAIICLLSSSYAAQLTIASYDITTENIVISGQDVLAPITSPAAHVLGYSLKEQNNTVTITNNDNAKEVMILTINSRDVSINGKKETLSTAPIKKDNELLLPLAALAGFMKMEFVQDKKKEVYQLLPTVNASYSSYNAKDIIIITSSLPIEYKFGVLTGHHRVYVDIYGSYIKKSSTTPIKGHSIYALRTNQFTDSPPVTRIVADLKEACEPTFRFEDNKRKLIITLEPKIKTSITSISFDADNELNTTTLKIESNKTLTPNITLDKGKLLLPLPKILTANELENVKKLSAKHIKKIDVIGNNTLEMTLDTDVIHTVISESTTFLLRFEKIDPNAVVTAQTRRPMPTKIKDAIVVIDAGHGGGDSGAVGQNKTYEKNINLDVALRTEKLLKAKGITVLMTRTTDKALVLGDRPKLGNGNSADLFVSIHCNSCPTVNTANGTETYYYTDMSIDFAKIMHQNLVATTQRNDRKYRKENYLVIRESIMPSVLVELAYINHSEEEKLLNDADFRQKAAQGICNGIVAYLKACGATE